MSTVGTVGVIAAVVIGIGVISNGGPVRNPDGTVDPGATVQNGARAGGRIVGDAAGEAADGVGGGLVDGAVGAVGSSDLAKAAAAGAGAYGGWKAWDRWGPGLKIGGGGPSDDTPPPAPAAPPVADPEPEFLPFTPPVWADLDDVPAMDLGGEGAGQWPGFVPCTRVFGTDVLGSSDC